MNVIIVEDSRLAREGLKSNGTSLRAKSNGCRAYSEIPTPRSSRSAWECISNEGNNILIINTEYCIHSHAEREERERCVVALLRLPKEVYYEHNHC